MVQIKLNISEKTGKTKQKELSEEESLILINKKIGDVFSGDALGFAGYEFKITGGSDSSGVPMRSDNSGLARKRILATNGIGIRKTRNGDRKRKLVAGNTIHELTYQVNVKVEKSGKGPLFEEPKAEESEQAPEQAPAQ